MHLELIALALISLIAIVLWQMNLLQKGKAEVDLKLTNNGVLSTKTNNIEISVPFKSEDSSLRVWIETKTDELLSYNSLIVILREKEINDIGYDCLLKTLEWQIKRLRILVRDGYTCQKCGHCSEHLHVHHKCYVRNELPWELPDLNLESLCYKCHIATHKSTLIPIMQRDANGSLRQTSGKEIFCSRCSGAGWFPEFRHVEAGICFQCRGNSLSRTVFSKALENFSQLNSTIYEDILLCRLQDFFSSLTPAIFEAKISNLGTPDVELNKPFSEDLPF